MVLNKRLRTTGRYMSLASVPRESSGQNGKPLMAAQAACNREAKMVLRQIW